VRIVGWSLLLPLAKSVVSLPRLTMLMRANPRAIVRDPEQEQAVASLTAWVFKTRPPGSRDNCLERALVTYRYLSRAGAHPQLVMGVAGTGKPVHGHAWVTVDGLPVHDSPSQLAQFRPILRFESDGRMIRVAAS
jgi:hypothetical protein